MKTCLIILTFTYLADTFIQIHYALLTLGMANNLFTAVIAKQSTQYNTIKSNQIYSLTVNSQVNSVFTNVLICV